jgi:hypothetical protein
MLKRAAPGCLSFGKLRSASMRIVARGGLIIASRNSSTIMSAIPLPANSRFHMERRKRCARTLTMEIYFSAIDPRDGHEYADLVGIEALGRGCAGSPDGSCNGTAAAMGARR